MVYKQTFPVWNFFPTGFQQELSRIAFPIIVLSEADHTDFAQEERLDLPYWTKILANCVSVDVPKYLHILTSEFSITNGSSSFLTWVYADTASAACPAHPGSLAMTSITFAAVMCDADDPCSVNTAYDPEPSFTMSPRSTTLPWYSGKLWLQLRTPEMTKIHQWRKKRTFLPSILASSITSFLFLTFVSRHAGIFAYFPISFPLLPSHPVFVMLEALD